MYTFPALTVGSPAFAQVDSKALSLTKVTPLVGLTASAFSSKNPRGLQFHIWFIYRRQKQRWPQFQTLGNLPIVRNCFFDSEANSPKI